jgi:quercetin dioxygenase-like cupin family protein
MTEVEGAHTGKPMAFKVRRIVTGTDARGKSVVSFDSVIDSRAGRYDDGTHVQELWQTDSLPPKQDGGDAVATRTKVTPTPKGTIVRMLHIPPGADGRELHRTATVDYFVVMDGEIEMTLDDGKAVTLRKGETCVMRNTMHGWRNTSGRMCLLFEVLIDARGAGGLLPPNVGADPHDTRGG